MARSAASTLKELKFQVRRQSVERTIAEICLDLGVTPSICEGATWSEILEASMHFGADLAGYFGVEQRRQPTFLKERDKRSGTWVADWRERPRDAIRALL